MNDIWLFDTRVYLKEVKHKMSFLIAKIVICLQRGWACFWSCSSELEALRLIKPATTIQAILEDCIVVWFWIYSLLSVALFEFFHQRVVQSAGLSWNSPVNTTARRKHVNLLHGHEMWPDFHQVVETTHCAALSKLQWNTIVFCVSIEHY